MSTLFASTRIFLGTGHTFIGGIVVNADGKINEILRNPSEVEAYRAENRVKVIDYGHHFIMPGLIDAHSHVNEPGRTDWEGYETITKAAAAGGFTTIVDMPLNSIPPTTTITHLEEKINAARNKLFVDVVPWGGLIPHNLGELQLLIQGGVRAFKCFLCPSGIDEFPNVSSDDVENALAKLQGTGCVLAFHAELEPEIPPTVDMTHPEKYETFLKTRPATMEVEAIKMIAEKALKFKDARLHIVHLSAADAIPIIRECRQNGGQLTVETCHHYLYFNAEDIPDYHTEYKCTPPIRDEENREELWKGLKNRDIDLLASDHSPCPPNLKMVSENGDGPSGNFIKAWGGIASNQFGLSIFWSNSLKYETNLADVYRLMCQNPADLIGVNSMKGKIAKGYDADFVIWSPEEEFTVTPEIIKFKHKLTPYMNRTLRGVVHATILRGSEIYNINEEFKEPTGRMVLHTE